MGNKLKTRQVSVMYLITVLTIAGSLSGCGIFNPYKGEFSCPNFKNGKCVSVETAYNEAIQGRTDAENSQKCAKVVNGKCLTKEEAAKLDAKKNGKTAAAVQLPSQELDYDKAYERETFKKLQGLIKQPITPIVSAPKVMRVLLLPYKGADGELFMSRYAYFMADDPKWVIGEYLMESND
ncbi:MAG: hypothetical protein CSYNP_04007 [Syntrophus sp. SKADARSKE-3]|nr:hypothetical protein [Syntrophus sp. SKADARSKE-3]